MARLSKVKITKRQTGLIVFLTADFVLLAALVWALTNKFNARRAPVGEAPSPVESAAPADAASASAIEPSQAAPPPTPASPAPATEDAGLKRNILFQYRSSRFKQVALSGDFNGWRPQPMQEGAGRLWRVTVSLAPGKYRYLFIADGRPMLDPSGRVKVSAPREAPARTVSLIVVKPR